jgi:phenylacetate-coenzyme A ligase PaaK-like adenylate-forming protein
LIRYVVDDKFILGSTDFLKNLLTPDIIQIQGRAGDTIELKDGSWVGCIDHAFKGIEHLECAQIHQYGTDKPIEIKLVAGNDFVTEDENQLRANIIRMVGDDMHLQFIYCKREDLTYSANQKYKLIIKHKL